MSNLMMPSRVLLYGRTMKGLRINVNVFDAGRGGAPGLGNNTFLRNQFVGPSAVPGRNDRARLAMIYGFEFEGHYYDLTAPTIMLVHGRGIDRRPRRRAINRAIVEAAEEAHNNGGTPAEIATAATNAAIEAGAPEAEAGIAAAEAFADGADADGVVAAATEAAAAAHPYVGRIESPFPGFPGNVKVWPYDKADFSMRLDPSSGPIESILLEAELEDDEFSDEMAGRKVSGRKVGGYRGRKMSGRKVGIRGRKVRGD